MRDARIELDWADGTYPFRLPWGQLAELQEKCDAGPYVILQRLHNGTWRIEDIANVIRLGLIGGGMPPAEALKKTRAYVEERPPMENVVPAQAILGIALMGAPDEPSGEADVASQTESSLKNSPTES
jgi:hypothetical protein